MPIYNFQEIRFRLPIFHHYANSNHEIYIFRRNNKRETAPECEYDFPKYFIESKSTDQVKSLEISRASFKHARSQNKFLHVRRGSTKDASQLSSSSVRLSLSGKLTKDRNQFVIKAANSSISLRKRAFGKAVCPRITIKNSLAGPSDRNENLREISAKFLNAR